MEMFQCMKKIFEFLKGKKTYVVAVAGAVYAALIGLGVVQSYDFVWGLLGSGAFAFLRAGIKPPQEQSTDAQNAVLTKNSAN
jgi:hypothetical protein